MKLYQSLFIALMFFFTGALAQPEFEWAIDYGASGEDVVLSQIVDSDGNVYSAGHFTGTVDFDPSPGVYNLTSDGAAKDIFISKIDSEGSLVWAINIGWGNDDGANEIAFDPSTGNIVITGYFMGTVDFNPGTAINNMSTYSSGSVGAFVLVLDTNAGFVWSRRSNRFSEGTSVAVSPNGIVYVGVNIVSPSVGQNIAVDGGGSFPSWSDDFYIWKLSNTGGTFWVKKGSVKTEPLSNNCMIANANDELIVGLTFSNSTGLNGEFGVPNIAGINGNDVLIFKLSSSGLHQWNRPITSASNIDCQVLHSVNDTTFYFGGIFQGSVNFNPPSPAFSRTSNGGYDGYIVGMDIDNNVTFSTSFGGTQEDLVYDISSNSLGEIYASGSFMGTADMDGSGDVNNLTSGLSRDGFVVKLNSSGNYVWAIGYGPGGDEVINNVNISSGAIYCGGTFNATVDFDPGQGQFNLTATGSSIDAFTVKLGDCIPTSLSVDAPSLSELTDECSVASPTAPTASNCQGTFSGTPDITFPITNQGTTVVTWTYDDGNGNSSSQTQDIVIEDVTAPIANVVSLSNVTSECSVSSLTAPTATDNCAGSITGTHNASLPITTQGTTTITWTYDDGNGNTATQTQNVVITDNNAPAADIASLSNVTAECSVTSLTAPTATDNCAGSITGMHNAALPITTQGTTTVTWTYDDGNGNSSTQTQEVIIDDVTAPVADVATLADVTAECAVTAVTAPAATDNCVGTVTGSHNATLPITTSTTITWTYDDGNGNTSTQSQSVIIDDSTAPVADEAILSSITDECAASPTAPTATDNCGGIIAGTPDVSFPVTTAGTTTVTWTYDDGNGNTSTQTQDVVITPIDDSISQIDAVSLTAEASGYNYQWVDCNNDNAPIEGETDQTFEAMGNGNYAVIIDNGTCSVTSDCFALFTVGSPEHIFSAVLIYPNPTTKNVFIDSTNPFDKVEVLNSIGQVLSVQEIGYTKRLLVELPESKGLFYIRVSGDGEFDVFKVIKN